MQPLRWKGYNLPKCNPNPLVPFRHLKRAAITSEACRGYGNQSACAADQTNKCEWDPNYDVYKPCNTLFMSDYHLEGCLKTKNDSNGLVTPFCKLVFNANMYCNTTDESDCIAKSRLCELKDLELELELERITTCSIRAEKWEEVLFTVAQSMGSSFASHALKCSTYTSAKACEAAKVSGAAPASRTPVLVVVLAGFWALFA